VHAQGAARTTKASPSSRTPQHSSERTYTPGGAGASPAASTEPSAPSTRIGTASSRASDMTDAAQANGPTQQAHTGARGIAGAPSGRSLTHPPQAVRRVSFFFCTIHRSVGARAQRPLNRCPNFVRAQECSPQVRPEKTEKLGLQGLDRAHARRALAAAQAEFGYKADGCVVWQAARAPNRACRASFGFECTRLR
jgi:hypothetical protein